MLPFPYQDNISDQELSDSQNVASSSTITYEVVEKHEPEMEIPLRPKSPNQVAKLIKRDRSTSFKEAKAQATKPKHERRNSAGNAECIVSEVKHLCMIQACNFLPFVH